MNNQGSIIDIITIIIIGFLMAIVGVILVTFVSTVNDALQADNNIPSQTKYFVDTANDDYPTMVDSIIIIMLFGLPVVSAIFAYFLDFSSILLWAMIIIMMLFIIIGAVFSNAWESATDGSSLQSAANNLTMTNFILNHYALYVLFAFLIVIAGMFFRVRSGQ